DVLRLHALHHHAGGDEGIVPRAAVDVGVGRHQGCAGGRLVEDDRVVVAAVAAFHVDVQTAREAVGVVVHVEDGADVVLAAAAVDVVVDRAIHLAGEFGVDKIFTAVAGDVDGQCRQRVEHDAAVGVGDPHVVAARAALDANAPPAPPMKVVAP